MIVVPLIAGFLLLLVLGSMWSGYVLSVLWAWFLVPLGMPALGVAQAIGLSIIVGMLTARHSKADDDGWISSVIFTVIAPLFALLAGWIVKGFV